MSVKILTARQAADLVPDGATLAANGFIGASTPEELLMALEERFVETGAPRDLTVMFAAAQGDRATRGLNHLAHDGMIRRCIGGHWGMAPKIGQMVADNKILAYDFPQGVMCHMFRDIAAHKPGVMTHVGLGTFVDPRLLGGKLNEKTRAAEDLVHLMELGGKEYLFYDCHPITFAVLAGTYADESGNISIEREAIRGETLAVAQACKNSGGTVIVQVENVVATGSLDPMKVEIPSILVDAVVVVSDMKKHMQTFNTQYNPGFSGEHRLGASAFTPAATLIQSNLAEVGITANIQMMESVDEIVSRAVDGNMPACITTWGCNPDPALVLERNIGESALGAYNVSRYVNEELEELWQYGSISENVEDRIPYYEQWQEILCEANPWVPLYVGELFALANADLQGVQLNTEQCYNFYDLHY